MTVRPLYIKHRDMYMADSGTASSIFCIIESDCMLEKVHLVNSAAVTTLANVFTYSINGGTPVALGNQPVQAAGLRTTFTVSPSVQLSANDVLGIISDGAGSGVSPTTCTAVVRELTR